MSARTFRIAFAALALFYVAQGLYFVRHVVPVSDGIQYLMVGRKALAGELTIFDDSLPGNRMPLPFYVLGMTQLGGPSLLLPRLLNVVLGLLTLVLVIGLAQRFRGDRAGLLAGVFFACQGVLVAYYSYEGYPAFAAFSVTLAVYLLFAYDTPGPRLAGTACAVALFFVRSNIWPAFPFLAAYALWRARGWRERARLVAIVVVPLAVFFASDPTHLKVLAYVPVVKHLVVPMGYDASVIMDLQGRLPLARQFRSLAILGRRYEFLVLAVAVVGTLWLWRWRRGRPSPFAGPRLAALAVFPAYMLVANFAMINWNWKWVGLYFTSFAPIVPVLLGLVYDAALADATVARRRVLLAILAVLVVPPVFIVRNPLLPIGEVKAQDPVASTHAAAAHLRRIVPHDARVFYYGLNTAYYLSGLPQTYFQQHYNPDAVARATLDERVIRRFGLVTLRDVERWLASDADFVVIDHRLFDSRSQEQHADSAEPKIREHVARRFELVDRVAEPPFSVYSVYRRKRRAPGAGSSAPERAAPQAEVRPGDRVEHERERRDERGGGDDEGERAFRHRAPSVPRGAPDRA